MMWEYIEFGLFVTIIIGILVVTLIKNRYESKYDLKDRLLIMIAKKLGVSDSEIRDTLEDKIRTYKN